MNKTFTERFGMLWRTVATSMVSGDIFPGLILKGQRKLMPGMIRLPLKTKQPDKHAFTRRFVSELNQ